MKNLKVVFMGTPTFAEPILEKLITLTRVELVVTQPDKIVGRKKILTPSPIKKLALENNIEVFTPSKIKEEYQKILDCKPDLIVTCAYGQIIPKILLDCPKYGCINVHASLLPTYRGGAPIQASLLNGDKETGVTLMYMAEGMDDGDIITEKRITIEKDDDIHSLSQKLSTLGADILAENLSDIIKGKITRIKQNSEDVSFAFIPKREEEKLDFNTSAKILHNKVRALTPYTYAIFKNQEMKIVKSKYIDEVASGKNGEIVKVDKNSFYIKCKEGLLQVLEITPFSKKNMLVRDYFNGIKKESLIGEVLNEEK